MTELRRDPDTWKIYQLRPPMVEAVFPENLRESADRSAILECRGLNECSSGKAGLWICIHLFADQDPAVFLKGCDSGRATRSTADPLNVTVTRH